MLYAFWDDPGSNVVGQLTVDLCFPEMEGGPRRSDTSTSLLRCLATSLFLPLWTVPMPPYNLWWTMSLSYVGLHSQSVIHRVTMHIWTKLPKMNTIIKAFPRFRWAALDQPAPGRPEPKDALVGSGDSHTAGDLGWGRRSAHSEGLPEEPTCVWLHLREDERPRIYKDLGAVLHPH